MVRTKGTFILAASLLAVSELFAGEPATAPAGSPGATVPGDAILSIQVSGQNGALRKALAGSDYGRLWEEPEVQAFIGPAWGEFKTYYAEQCKQNPALPSLDDLRDVLSGDWAFTVGAPAGPMPRVCVAVRMADAEQAGRLLRAFTQGAKLEEGKPVEAGPLLKLVYEKGLVLAANDAEAFQTMRARIQNGNAGKDGLATSAGEQALRKLFGADGDGFAHASLAVPKLLETLNKANPGQAKELETFKAFLDKCGLTGLRAFGLRLGQRGEFLSLDSALQVEGEPKGLIADLITAQPLPASVLQGVPADATFCSAGRMNLGRSLATVRELLGADQSKDLEQGLAELKQMLGVDVEKELLPALGETWTLYDVGGQEMLGMLPGFALALEVKDEDAAAKALKKITNALTDMLAKQMGGGFGPGWSLKETKLGAVQINYVNIDPFPMAPALAIHKGRLVVTPSIASMRSAVKALAVAPRWRTHRG